MGIADQNLLFYIMIAIMEEGIGNSPQTTIQDYEATTIKEIHLIPQTSNINALVTPHLLLLCIEGCGPPCIDASDQLHPSCPPTPILDLPVQ